MAKLIRMVMARWGWSGVWGVQLVLTAHRLWLNCFSFSHLTFSPILSKFFLILACGSPSLWVMHHLYYRMGCLTEPMMSSRYVIVTSSAYKGRAKGSLLESCSFSPFISFSWLAFSTVRLFFFTACFFLDAIAPGFILAVSCTSQTHRPAEGRGGGKGQLQEVGPFLTPYLLFLKLVLLKFSILQLKAFPYQYSPLQAKWNFEYIVFSTDRHQVWKSHHFQGERSWKTFSPQIKKCKNMCLRSLKN